MAQSEDVIQLEAIHFSTVSDPELYGYGKICEGCHDFSYTFRGGRAYGIIGECGTGGWALSYFLAGRDGGNPDGEIRLNGQLADQKLLQAYSCYVGDGIFGRGWRGNYGRTIRHQLLRGIRKNNKYTIDEITELFELAPTRLDRRMDQIGNERWSASAAIGLVQGKQIFCYPWLHISWFKTAYPRIKHCVKVLKEHGAIIVIPTTRVQNVERIVDEIIPISHPSEHKDLSLL